MWILAKTNFTTKLSFVLKLDYDSGIKTEFFKFDSNYFEI
jgi:hypothetical protein